MTEKKTDRLNTENSVSDVLAFTFGQSSCKSTSLFRVQHQSYHHLWYEHDYEYDYDYGYEHEHDYDYEYE